MQFNIPQFIDVEDKIIGPLTLKQFLYLAGAGVFLFFVWYFSELWVFIIFAVPVGSFAIALAFVKINGRPLINYVAAFIAYIRKPRLYVWRKKH
jgi:hypothetical protein